jgi:ectoine hydroxylase-related dioxygenase (phytanoyl-CoA dioxygenase family)
MILALTRLIPSSPSFGAKAFRPVVAGRCDIQQTTFRLQSTLVKELNLTDDSTMSQASPMTRYPTEMTEDERYLFDLNGFIIVKSVLTIEEVQEANSVIDRHAHEMVERQEGALRNAVQGTKFYGDGPGRMDLGKCLEWGADESRVFQSILAHPRLVPLFHGILGKGYRMDHLPLILAQNKGSEGFQLHGGTIDCTSGEYNPHLAYHCHHETIRSSLLGCNVILTDHNAGDGGFCIVPGSHKSNFRMPKGMVDGEKYEEFIIQPPTKAGDVILFSEGTVHGAKSWTSDQQRRTALYRFAPATAAYGRSFFGHEGGGWPVRMYEGLTEAEKAVLEPPYANRLDRPNINPDGSVEITQRSERKRQHDREVFGTKYF